ncbi:alanine racemase [Tenuifilum thalassicum]|uniref:Alanine racemase n=1 Tax=Tenuifilum thalassicum TaxID=2590900 RepID=A0A7D3Y404_9BACT|nr:alanine racemase [Tenuifilum thalassicum]QKG79669.1 alanine racemase [Tenuifilum thalassicum]
MISDYPFLLVDIERCERNIADMAIKAKNAKLSFRPHFKTHQSRAIGRLFKKYGVDKITVSSIGMAEYFASDGWCDITIAFPFIPHTAERVNALAEKINLNLIFSSPRNLLAALDVISAKIGVFIEIDVGQNRSGILPEDTRTQALMLNLIADKSNFSFKGFLTHAGHSYSARGKSEIEKIHTEALTRLAKLRAFWKEQYPDIIISYGDTPTCSVADDFWGISEIRPGNFVFYDTMQLGIGSCNVSQIAAALIVPVVDVYPEKQKLIVHGGAVHLSKEKTAINGIDCYGLVSRFNNKVWDEPTPGAYVKSLSQEHGIIQYENGSLDDLKPGDLLAILPVHSCLTVDSMGAMYDFDGNVYDVLSKNNNHEA